MPATHIERLRRMTTCGLLACALVVPAASARPLDGPSPATDAAARDASHAGTIGAPRQDLRSPDARGVRTSSLAGTTGESRLDLRSPDARDSATRHPSVPTSNAPLGTPEAATPGGFDWSTAGVTAAILVGLLVSSFAAAIAVRQRRNHIPGA